MNVHFHREGVAPLSWMREFISHRGMDVGSMYVPVYGTNVSLSVINKDIGIAPVSHNALQDAEDNITAFRQRIFANMVVPNEN